MIMRVLMLAALLLWGYSTGTVLVAFGLALLLEAPLLLRWQSAIEPLGFFRIADFTSLVFSALAIFCFTRYGVYGIYAILEWLPCCLLFPLLVQRLSSRGRTPLGALFFRLRKQGWDAGTIDWHGPYLACCLLGAAFGQASTNSYFIAVPVLLGGLLFASRPRHSNRLIFVTLLLACMAMAWLGNNALRAARQELEAFAAPWFYSWLRFDRDPELTITAIGSIGRLKASDAIQVRVHNATLPRLPLYLHEASYNDFNNGIWSARDPRSEAIDPDLERRGWTLATTAGTTTIDISVHHARAVGVVPVPLAPTRVTGKEIVEVQRNALGTLLLEAPPGAIRYQVTTGTAPLTAPDVRDADLAVPASYRKMIASIAERLDLAAVPEAEAIGRIERHFTTDFHYALPGASGVPWRKTLADFLLRQHSGHCEYFATATVLLARAAGIPARYSVGYLVQEYSRWERAWVARARHRHAWASVFVDGRWRILDTTPSVWFEQEQEASAGGEWLIDAFAWVRYRIERIGRDTEAHDRTPLLWAVPPLLLLLFWRLSHGSLRISRVRASRVGSTTPRHGMDSAVYRLIARYRKQGYEFLPGETLACWLRRAVPESPERARLLDLHYRYRFDPLGLSRLDRDELRALAAQLAVGQ